MAVLRNSSMYPLCSGSKRLTTSSVTIDPCCISVCCVSISGFVSCSVSAPIPFQNMTLCCGIPASLGSEIVRSLVSSGSNFCRSPLGLHTGSLFSGVSSSLLARSGLSFISLLNVSAGPILAPALYSTFARSLLSLADHRAIFAFVVFLFLNK